MELFVFLVAGGACILGALGVVLNRNPVHAALSLVGTLFGIAVLFVAQEAHFLAADVDLRPHPWTLKPERMSQTLAHSSIATFRPFSNDSRSIRLRMVSARFASSGLAKVMNSPSTSHFAGSLMVLNCIVPSRVGLLIRVAGSRFRCRRCGSCRRCSDALRQAAESRR